MVRFTVCITLADLLDFPTDPAVGPNIDILPSVHTLYVW